MGVVLDLIMRRLNRPPSLRENVADGAIPLELHTLPLGLGEIPRVGPETAKLCRFNGATAHPSES